MGVGFADGVGAGVGVGAGEGVIVGAKDMIICCPVPLIVQLPEENAGV